MDISWIKGSENDSDVFTKNLDGPALNKCSNDACWTRCLHENFRLLLIKEGVRRYPGVFRRASSILNKLL